MITVKNIYYLLLYAWDKFDEGRMVSIDAEPDTDLVNLLALVLTRGIDQLLRRGLDRGYLSVAEELAGIRGKLDLSTSIKSNLLPRARTACQFDELSHDVLHNQILKAMLVRLMKAEGVEREVRSSVRIAFQRMPECRSIQLTRRHFHAIQLHRNTRFYRFLIDVCRLLFEHLSPDEAMGSFRFRDFSRDEVRMRSLFEKFLRNFYKHEQFVFKVQGSQFTWAKAVGEGAALLPVMKTDVTLKRPGRQIVIDAKYTPHVLQHNPHGETPKFDSKHLFQLFRDLAPDAAIRTYDIKPCPNIGLLNSLGIDCRVADPLATESHQELVEFIRRPGTTMILCDGGNKPAEVKAVAEIAKPDDFVLAHDYAPNHQVFKNNIRGKRWNWCEITDADLPFFGIQPIDSPKLRNAMWFCGEVGPSHEKTEVFDTTVLICDEVWIGDGTR